MRRGIPRFVPEQNYAESFGFEWTLYGDLQYDRLQDNTMTRDRFYQQTGLTPEDLRGKKVLEAGCGGGRFSDVVLAAGAELYAIDLSVAVDKNRELHPGHPRLNLAQASILEPPFAPGTFDLVFCFGVIQHTPDPAATFRALAPLVKAGGRLAVDVYAAHPKQSSHWKYLIRPVTKRMDHTKLHAIIDRSSHVLYPVSRTILKVPVVGKWLSRFVPIFVHDGFVGRVPRDQERRQTTSSDGLRSPRSISPRYFGLRLARSPRWSWVQARAVRRALRLWPKCLRSSVDVDECVVSNGGCAVSAACTNTPGSATCPCQSGWTGDGKTCQDVNECATVGTCGANAVCANTPGSFGCSCVPGYLSTEKGCVQYGSLAAPAPSCQAIKKAHTAAASASYWLNLAGTAVPVFCEMVTDGGGWARIDYKADLLFKHQGLGNGPKWLPQNFLPVLTPTQLAALQKVSTEGKQTYVGLCNHFRHY